MSSPASIKKHPIHPMLVAVPIGLWVFSLVSDLIYKAGWGDSNVWSKVALYTMAGGVIGALIAAVPGLIDYKAITNRTVTKIATAHMTINLIVVGLYAVNLWQRARHAPDVPTAALVLSIVAVVLLGISGWLGGEMIYVHGVAVEPQHDTREEEVAEDRISP